MVTWVVEAHGQLWMGSTPESLIDMVEAHEEANGLRACTLIPIRCESRKVGNRLYLTLPGESHH